MTNKKYAHVQSKLKGYITQDKSVTESVNDTSSVRPDTPVKRESQDLSKNRKLSSFADTIPFSAAEDNNPFEISPTTLNS